VSSMSNDATTLAVERPETLPHEMPDAMNSLRTAGLGSEAAVGDSPAVSKPTTAAAEPPANKVQASARAGEGGSTATTRKICASSRTSHVPKMGPEPVLINRKEVDALCVLKRNQTTVVCVVCMCLCVAGGLALLTFAVLPKGVFPTLV
jgi:hypothetical protein